MWTKKDNKIFLWHVCKRVDNTIYTFRARQSSKWYIIVTYFFLEYTFYVIMLLYDEGKLGPYRTKPEHIHWGIEHLYIRTLRPWYESLLIGDRVGRYDIDFSELVEVEKPEKPYSDSEKFMKEKWNLFHVFISLIEEMTREWVRIVHTLGSFFQKMDSSDRFIRKDCSIVLPGDLMWEKKSPLHPHKSDPTSMKSWKDFIDLTMVAHICWIIAVSRPYSCRDISGEDIRHIDIGALSTSSHEKRVVENQSFHKIRQKLTELHPYSTLFFSILQKWRYLMNHIITNVNTFCSYCLCILLFFSILAFTIS